MNEVVREFLLETQENLAQLDLDLVTLEKEPYERETLARAFRTLHTVKGTAGFLGLMRLQAVAHAAENLLSKLRAGELIFNPSIASALLATVDAIRRMLEAVEQTEQEGSGDYTELIQTLERLKTAEAKSAPTITHAIEAPPALAAPEPQPEPIESRPAAVADTSIRVDVGQLDKLMNLVGELVLARNQIMQLSSSLDDNGFLTTVQRLNLLTTELQAGVMKTRMQPIGNVLAKFPRLVRDIAVACGKQVHLDMDGKDTELDKTIIEAIRDPLTHLVRNAVDHGIEMPDVRQARGKPPEGRLALHAFHEGGKVIIEIRDDGGGIDVNRVRAKAISVGLITAEQASRLSEREIIHLIFAPGFSTADKVTNFSGRGVGMDVVRTNIEKIGGVVDVESQLGRGSTIKMKIPLTLAIIPALTVTAGGDRYAIPQVSLLELVRAGGAGGQPIEAIHGAPVYRLRGNLLPLVYLDRVLQVESKNSAASDAGQIIVVLQADDRQFGLIVDDIHDTEEIVVKPLQKQLKGTNVFSGATIMGDGKIALILDVLGLAQRAHVISGVKTRTLEEKPASTAAEAGERQNVLLFATPDGGRMAIPLSLVARLEEFPRSALEKVGAQHVVQYRDAILPLIDVAAIMRPRRRRPTDKHSGNRRRRTESPTVQVVVHADEGCRVGLVVGQILDIVEESVTTRSRAARPGVLFTAVVQGKVTEFLDVDAVIRAADVQFADDWPSTGARQGAVSDS